MPLIEGILFLAAAAIFLFREKEEEQKPIADNEPVKVQ